MEQLMSCCGTVKISCDEKLYGKSLLDADYILYQSQEETFSHELKLVQENYKQMYDDFLEQILTAYRKNARWQVWDEANQGFKRVPFEKKEDLHPYLGEPVIEVMNQAGHPVIGLSFHKNNPLSMEHGLCAVYENLRLLMIDADDFSNMVYNWDFCLESNIMTQFLD